MKIIWSIFHESLDQSFCPKGVILMLKKHGLGINPYIENMSSRDQSLVRMGTSRVTLPILIICHHLLTLKTIIRRTAAGSSWNRIICCVVLEEQQGRLVWRLWARWILFQSSSDLNLLSIYCREKKIQETFSNCSCKRSRDGFVRKVLFKVEWFWK